MTIRRIAVFCILITIAGCTDLDGVFEPACMALEGDRVMLQNGRFEWHKFTDERRIDDSGNVIDPFPGYPVKGNYELSGKKVEFHADSGDQLADYFLVEQQGALYLLNAEQHQAVSDGNAMPSCALHHKEEDSSN